MRKFFWFLIAPLLIAAQATTVNKSPQQIQKELDAAEAEFKNALTLFNPWYTGPLLTPSASMMPVGMGNLQPYLFITDTYASFNKKRKSVNFESQQVQVKGAAYLQTGITPNFDLNLNFSGQSTWQFDENGGGYGDMTLTAGFLINKQTRFVPQIKLTVTETFPTGKYKNLSHNGLGLNATGQGAYSTQFGLVFGKLFGWSTQHPINTRLALSYQLSTVVDVRNFNSYGGGFGTRGRVHPGNVFAADLGIEYSINQRWVLATDVVYTATDSTKFHGHLGTTADGTPAGVGGGYSDNLSISPAFEYNFNGNVGLIAGVWFSVYGRNSGNFGSGIISVSYTFP